MSSGTALLHLVFIALMLLLITGGSITLLALWFTRGRDPRVMKAATYIEHPPDDLPPGAAGTLLDEHADRRDIVATLLGLGRHGAVIVQDVGTAAGDTPRKGHRPGDFTITVVDPAGVTSHVEKVLLRILFNGDPAPGAEVRLADVRDRFAAGEPEIRDALYEAMVIRGYFTVSPVVTRKRWRRGAWIGLALSTITGLFLTIRVDPFAILATIAAAIIFLVLVRMSRAMPQKTRTGAEAAEQWRAFRRYLASIEKYENVNEASQLFDRYFAYAVAFDLQDKWLKTFARSGARTPGWFVPVGDLTGRGDSVGDVIFDAMTMAHWAGHVGGGGGGDMDINLPDIGMPNLPDMGNVDLQGLSDLAGGSLQGASDGLSALLESAGSIFESIDFDIFD